MVAFVCRNLGRISKIRVLPVVEVFMLLEVPFTEEELLTESELEFVEFWVELVVFVVLSVAFLLLFLPSSELLLYTETGSTIKRINPLDFSRIPSKNNHVWPLALTFTWLSSSGSICDTSAIVERSVTFGSAVKLAFRKKRNYNLKILKIL